MSVIPFFQQKLIWGNTSTEDKLAQGSHQLYSGVQVAGYLYGVQCCLACPKPKNSYILVNTKAKTIETLDKAK